MLPTALFPSFLPTHARHRRAHAFSDFPNLLGVFSQVFPDVSNGCSALSTTPSATIRFCTLLRYISWVISIWEITLYHMGVLWSNARKYSTPVGHTNRV